MLLTGLDKDRLQTKNFNNNWLDFILLALSTILEDKVAKYQTVMVQTPKPDHSAVSPQEASQRSSIIPGLRPWQTPRLIPGLQPSSVSSVKVSLINGNSCNIIDLEVCSILINNIGENNCLFMINSLLLPSASATVSLSFILLFYFIKNELSKKSNSGIGYNILEFYSSKENRHEP